MRVSFYKLCAMDLLHTGIIRVSLYKICALGMLCKQAHPSSLYIDVQALEQDEAEVERMASWTIALNKEKLAAMHRKQGILGQVWVLVWMWVWVW
jgi:hypothetical protein